MAGAVGAGPSAMSLGSPAASAGASLSANSASLGAVLFVDNPGTAPVHHPPPPLPLSVSCDTHTPSLPPLPPPLSYGAMFEDPCFFL